MLGTKLQEILFLDEDENEEEQRGSNNKWAVYSRIVERLGALHGKSCVELAKEYIAFSNSVRLGYSEAESVKSRKQSILKNNKSPNDEGMEIDY